MSNLTANDIRRFGQAFITPEIIEAAKLRRVTDVEGAAMFGRNRNANSDYSGIAFAYTIPGNLAIREYRLRRDNPDLEMIKGEPKEKGKYLWPPGRPNLIYFPPAISLEHLRDTSIPIVITEGEKKALALNRVAWHGLGDAAEKPRFLALGVGGVWGFRGIVAKAITSNGARQPVKGLIPDFDLIALRDRKLTIVYDANARTNESVQAATKALAKEMSGLEAHVLVSECPEIEGCNGIDDVLGTWEQTQDENFAVEHCLKLLDGAETFKAEKTSQTSQLLRIAKDLELFHTPEGEPFAKIEVDGHIEHHKLNSHAFRQRLAFLLFKENGRGPSSQAVQDVVQVISGQARFEGLVCPVHLRIAGKGGKIYVDLCNETWQIIEIDATGWKIIESATSPVLFKRTGSMRPLPTPCENGDINKLGSYLNVNPTNLIMVVGWLVNCFRPDFPFPILILAGEQGTAKSTASKVLRELIDPSIAPLRSSPRNERDLVIAANSSWVIGLDNLSHIPDWLSDALCRLSTGGGFGARTLYSDDEETVFNSKRPIVINGIGNLTSRSDLLDRALMVRLEPIPLHRRKAERAFWTEFEREKPNILGALLSAVSCGIRNLGNINFKELPRMADFAQWVMSCEPELGMFNGAFLKVYLENRRGAHSIVLEESLLAEVIQEFCESNLTNSNESDVTDVLLTDFLQMLKNVAGDKRLSDKRFPESSKGLRNGIERINPNLREIGIHITFHGRKGSNASKGASLSLAYRENHPSPTSQTSSDPKEDGDRIGERSSSAEK